MYYLTSLPTFARPICLAHIGRSALLMKGGYSRSSHHSGTLSAEPMHPEKVGGDLNLKFILLGHFYDKGAFTNDVTAFRRKFQLFRPFSHASPPSAQTSSVIEP